MAKRIRKHGTTVHYRSPLAACQVVAGPAFLSTNLRAVGSLRHRPRLVRGHGLIIAAQGQAFDVHWFLPFPLLANQPVAIQLLRASGLFRHPNARLVRSLQVPLIDLELLPRVRVFGEFRPIEFQLFPGKALQEFLAGSAPAD